MRLSRAGNTHKAYKMYTLGEGAPLTTYGNQSCSLSC